MAMSPMGWIWEEFKTWRIAGSQKETKPSEITREFLGERIDSKKDPHVFFFRTLDVPKKSSLGLFFPKSGRFFFWDVSNPVVLGSASGAVAPIFPWLSMGRWTCQ